MRLCCKRAERLLDVPEQLSFDFDEPLIVEGTITCYIQPEIAYGMLTGMSETRWVVLDEYLAQNTRVYHQWVEGEFPQAAGE